ncbi:MAG: CHASE domain-containing protein [Candidatus Omnitrophica bacterium]|nr:CHASE domain-containing protein [Candidatus Omnitrophota bacterium]
MRARHPASGGIALATATFGVLLTATWFAWRYTLHVRSALAAKRFEQRAAEITADLDQRLKLYVSLLQGVQGLYAASRSVERDEFVTYVNRVNQIAPYPGAVGIRFVERVPADAVDAFIQRVRTDTSVHAEGYPEFQIHPPGQREEYYVNTYLYPMNQGDSALGFDIRTEASRREACERARDSGELSATGRMIFSQDQGKPESSIRLVLPIYRNGVPHGTPEQRRAALQGFVTSVIHAQALVAEAVRIRALAPEWDVEIFDGALLDGEHRLYDVHPATEAARPIAGGLQRATTVGVGGRTWTLIFATPSRPELPRLEEFLPWMVLGIGALLSGLVSMLVHVLTTAKNRAAALAERMTANLRQTANALQAVVQASPVAILSMNAQGEVLTWNPAAERLFGWSEQEVVGKLVPIVPEGRQEDFRTVMQEELAGTGHALERPCLRKDGSLVEVSVLAAPLRNANGAIIGVLSLLTDITERKRSEEQLRQANVDLLKRERAVLNVLADLKNSHERLQMAQTQLIQAEKMSVVGRLASGIAHEVKNPLQVITQGVDYLQGELPSDDRRYAEAIHLIRDAVIRADRIVRELLSYSRPSRLQLSPVALHALVSKSLELLGRQAAVGNVQILIEVPETLPMVMLDDNQMQQVFINLIVNALHAMPAGGTLTIRAAERLLAADDPLTRLRLGEFQAGERVVVCEVQDTGIGIPEDALSKVFDPFFTTKPPEEGTGLGLSISRAIIEHHRGAIVLRSAPGQGTTVAMAFHI